MAKDQTPQGRTVTVKVYPNLPHPQAALLQDWIDGLDIQYRDENGEWIDMPRALDYFPNDFRANPKPRNLDELMSVGWNIEK